MERRYKIIIPVALLSIALFATGQLLFYKIFAFFEPHVEGIFFQIIAGGGKLKTSLLFSLVLALLPVLIALLWRLSPILSPTRRIYSVIAILAAIGAGILFRHLTVKTYFVTVVRPFLLAQNRLPMQYPINPVNFVYYMCKGLLIGIVIAFFLFRQKKERIK